MELLPNVTVVLYISKTPNNLNMLFFSCPSFKIKLNHCKFFLWLDQHAAKFGRAADMKGVKESKDDVDEHFWRLNVENRVAELEARLASIDKNGSINWWLMCAAAIEAKHTLTDLTLTSPHRAAITHRPSPSSAVLTSPSLFTVLQCHLSYPTYIVPSSPRGLCLRRSVTVRATCLSWY
ncbi:hypothetical protein PIB30_081607 [Stylosanthes scabra]|uniref:Uncharacterized protein n=1 Tax=Stylosanthes scabra TaxID=79078 RepID=A0ABU6QU69_9FABA|nr:hypothetical protein [Stylosanthes scabra]